MKITAGKRRIDYDLIRILACASVLIFHSNASVCGFDTVGQLVYPNELIPSVYLAVCPWAILEIICSSCFRERP